MTSFPRNGLVQPVVVQGTISLTTYVGGGITVQPPGIRKLNGIVVPPQNGLVTGVASGQTLPAASNTVKVQLYDISASGSTSMSEVASGVTTYSGQTLNYTAFGE